MQYKIDNFINIDPLLNEIDDVIKKGLNNILKDFIDRHELLEKTHKQIMRLPSVLDEINNNNSDNNDDELSVEDVPIFESIRDMTHGLVIEEVASLEKKFENLEKK